MHYLVSVAKLVKMAPRRSKEPRRISVVEGRAAASLARDLTTASCFIYNNETIKYLFRQSLPEHLLQNCFASGGGCWLQPKSFLHRGHCDGATILLWDRVSQPSCNAGLRPKQS